MRGVLRRGRPVKPTKPRLAGLRCGDPPSDRQRFTPAKHIPHQSVAQEAANRRAGGRPLTHRLCDVLPTGDCLAIAERPAMRGDLRPWTRAGDLGGKQMTTMRC